jgi:hypothetical protein
MTRLLGVIAELRPGGRADLGEAFERIGNSLPRRSLVLVLSDLMEEPASWTSQLSALVSRRTDVRVAHIHDPAEWNLDYRDAGRFVSPEGGAPLVLDPDDVRTHFRTVVQEYTEEVAMALGRCGIRHHLVSTQQEMSSALARVLGAR